MKHDERRWPVSVRRASFAAQDKCAPLIKWTHCARAARPAGTFSTLSAEITPKLGQTRAAPDSKQRLHQYSCATRPPVCLFILSTNNQFLLGRLSVAPSRQLFKRRARKSRTRTIRESRLCACAFACARAQTVGKVVELAGGATGPPVTFGQPSSAGRI